MILKPATPLYPPNYRHHRGHYDKSIEGKLEWVFSNLFVLSSVERIFITGPAANDAVISVVCGYLMGN